MQDISKNKNFSQMTCDNIEKELFVDASFVGVWLSEEDEKKYIQIQTTELVQAKEEFSVLTIDRQIACIRYMFSHRIFQSDRIGKEEVDKLKTLYLDSYGSLCSETVSDELEQNCIVVESPIVTRILYLTESLEEYPYREIFNELISVNGLYRIIFDTIEERRVFHYRNL